MTDVYESKVRTKLKQKDGSFVEVGLKTGDFKSVEDILNYPGCMCNLMPAANFDEQLGKLTFPVEYTIDKPHPQAYYTCSAEEWKTSATVREEWEQAQHKLEERYYELKAERQMKEQKGLDKKDGLD